MDVRQYSPEEKAAAFISTNKVNIRLTYRTGAISATGGSLLLKGLKWSGILFAMVWVVYHLGFLKNLDRKE